MNHHFSNRLTIAFLLACAMLSGSALQLHAAWGSVRANNRGGEFEPRGVPAPPVRPPQPRTEVRQAPQPRTEVRQARPEVHEERRVEAPRHEGEIHRNVEVERRPVVAHEPERRFHIDHDFDIDRERAHFWSHIRRGMLFPTLPVGWITLNVGGAPYYYYDGVYYQDSSSGYVVVTPPVGAIVAALPDGATTVEVNGILYYYAAGAFYLQQPSGYFAVVPAPIGVTVSTLPTDAAPVTINGYTYYLADGVYYMPVMQGGITVYETVRL